MLRTRVQCRAVLAITATATASTAAAVARVLDIAPDGIIRDDSVRANLRLSVVHTNGGADLGHIPAAACPCTMMCMPFSRRTWTHGEVRRCRLIEKPTRLRNPRLAC